MAITVNTGHVARAIDFYNKQSIYYAIGRSEQPWDDESAPPEPNITDTIEDVFGYKRVEAKYLVVPDDHGTISYRGTKWRIVSAEEAAEEGSRWVYISAHLEYDELPLKAFRQVGVFTGLEANDEVSTDKYNLLPSEVKKQGILEILDNRMPVFRQFDQREHLSLIVEF